MQPDDVIDIPLYVQIATRLRHRIASGELRRGDALPSLRDGAKRWGVNLHTVRRAYAALQQEDLVTTVPRRGTKVAVESSPALEEHAEDLSSFVARVARVGAARFGVSAAELGRRVARVGDRGDAAVFVLECSAYLARSLARQVARWSGLNVRPWPLDRAGDVPDGCHLGTYYHYAEIREALGDRGQPGFFGVRMEEENLNRLSEKARVAGRLVVMGVDGDTGAVIASDLAGALGDRVEVELRLTHRPRQALASVPAAVPVLVSPENWDRLAAEERSGGWLFPLALRPVEEDLARIAAAFGWRRPSGSREGGDAS